jgi:hypothetical protein
LLGIWRATNEPVEGDAGNHVPGVSPVGHPRGGGADRLAERVAVAVAGFLARYEGQSRVHTASDLRVFLTWCTEHGLDPLDPVQVCSTNTRRSHSRCRVSGTHRRADTERTRSGGRSTRPEYRAAVAVSPVDDRFPRRRVVQGVGA